MRLRSLLTFIGSIALASGCSGSSVGSGRNDVRGSDGGDHGDSGSSSTDSGSGEGTAFTEVDNGFESDDPQIPQTRRGTYVRNGVNTSANSASGSVENNAYDRAATRAVEEADIIKLDGNRLFALSRYGGLAVVDITNPDEMKLLGRKRTDGVPFEMYVQGGRAFVMLNAVDRWVTDDQPHYRHAPVQTSQILAFDVSNPASITEVSHVDVPGAIADSRMVGANAYVVTYEDGHCWRCQDDAATIVTSFAVGSAITKRDQLVYASQQRGYSAWKRSVSATDQRLYIAGPDWGWAPGISNASSIIEVVDIGNPTGKLTKGSAVHVDGKIDSRWQMDEHAGVLRVVSQFGNRWGRSGQINPKVETFEVTSSMQITPLGSTELILPKPEQLRSVRFDGTRGYAITAERTDPLFTIDLSDPAAPRQAGELEMPGWIFHMEPRGDRLIGFGYDDTNQQTASLAVSLFDVGDLARPTMLKRVSFGGGGGQLAEDQDRIHKSVRVLDDAGMVVVPFASHGRWNGKKCEAAQSGIQLIDYGHDDLTLRGLAPQWGMPRRAFVANGRLLAMSDRNVTSFDIASRDAPAKKHELDLSNPAYRLADLPDHLASITSDPWSGEVMLSLTPKADADDAAVTGKLSLASLAPPSATHCSGRSGWTSWYEARLFGGGKNVYVAVPSYTYDGSAPRGRLIAAAIDVSDPLRPVLTGKTEMPFAEQRDPWEGGYAGWYGGFPDGRAFHDSALNGVLVGSGQAAVQHGAKLAYLEVDQERVQSGTEGSHPIWATRAHRRLHVVDFGSPAEPKTYAIELPPSLGSAPLHLDHGTVLTSRWVQSTKAAEKVRFFVDRIDLNGPAPIVLSSINTPGSLLLADEASSRFVTTDYHVERAPLEEEPNLDMARYVARPKYDCSSELGNDAWYDPQIKLCKRVTRDFKLADVIDTKVTLRHVLTLPSQNIAGVETTDDRIYVTRATRYDDSGYRSSIDSSPEVLEEGGLWAIGGIRDGQLAIVSEMAGVVEWPLAAHGTKVALDVQGSLSVYDTATLPPALLTQTPLRDAGRSSHVLMNDTRAFVSLGEWGLQTIAY
jgi:hypothetical protein